jgi:hypothetical protein
MNVLIQFLPLRGSGSYEYGLLICPTYDYFDGGRLDKIDSDYLAFRYELGGFLARNLLRIKGLYLYVSYDDI